MNKVVTESESKSVTAHGIFNINISMSEDIYSDTTGMVTIKADDNVVYSKELNKYTEPVLEIDIPINNCSLLKICYDSNHNFSSEGCIISDAILYN